MIVKVLKGSGISGSGEGDILDAADRDAVEEVNVAYNDVKVIDCLDVSDQGNQSWETAKKRCALHT